MDWISNGRRETRVYIFFPPSTCRQRADTGGEQHSGAVHEHHEAVTNAGARCRLTGTDGDGDGDAAVNLTLKELCVFFHLYHQVADMSGRVGDLSPKQAEALEQVSFITTILSTIIINIINYCYIIISNNNRVS